MRRRLGLALGASIMLFMPAAAHASLSTPWTHLVGPTHPRPDYPRPDAVRSEWKSLNGRWQFAFSSDLPRGAPGVAEGVRSLPRSIVVPFSFEAPLSGIGRGREVHERVWYRRDFTVPAGWTGRRVLLHFGAVDWQTTVWLNGHRLGTHRGGYDPFEFDVTPLLKPGGAQRLVVAVLDRDDRGAGLGQARGKQRGSGNIWYTRTTGIWQPVWIEPVAPDHIDYVVARGDPVTGRLNVHAAVAGTGARQMTVRVGLGGATVAQDSAPVGRRRADAVLTVPSPRPWTPESPTLYWLELTLADRDGAVVDEVGSYAAFRTVGLVGGRFALNGRPYFLRGVLDQGYWPDGVYTAPTDDALRADVEAAKALGFNLVRKHVKVEDPRWYYWCDRLGILVAQDMPSADRLASASARAQFMREWRAMVLGLHGHPSIAMWIAFNERWGHPGAFQDAVVDAGHALDPTRPIVGMSGAPSPFATDMDDVHDYGSDLARHVPRTQRPARPRWIGEMGGTGVLVPGHAWAEPFHAVGPVSQLVKRFRRLTGQVNGAGGLSGFVYTQLADVEQELNGLMTYDRRFKASPATFRSILEAPG